MNRVRAVCLVTCLIFGLGIFIGPISQQQAMAKSEGVVSPSPVSLEQTAPPEEDRLEFDTKYPVLSGAADSPFEFEVGIRYLSAKEKALDFDLSVEVPQGWIGYIAESKYSKDKEISAISLEPYGIKEKLLVVAMAPFWLYPEPGEYTLTLKVSSGEVKGSMDLTARITARYDLSAGTKLEGGRLNIKAEADKENYLPISVTNTGTATLDKVTLSSSKPEGWSVTFSPEKVESLSAGTSQEVEVT
ncbi:MAG: NEW3 domain-containing protein, partial [Chloroflexota bacterium]|nr:NEW3 domain-containing protein [Chloroflexota bacterium]